MSKKLEATCVNGIVTAGGVPVPETEILSEGVGASSGVLLIDESLKTYIPKTSPDLEATLTQVIAALSAAASAITASATLFGTMASPVWDVQPAGAAAAASAATAASSASAAITAARTALETLKGALR